MSELPVGDLRQRAWHHFQEAEQHAKAFASGWEWVKLERVDVTGEALWHEDGRIEVPDAGSDAVFHEVFHSALHNSPFKQRAESIECRFYCECLCHTFQYFMEKLLLPAGGSWVKRMESWAGSSYQDIIEQHSRNKPWDYANGLATHCFITASGDDLENFCQLFQVMNRQEQ